MKITLSRASLLQAVQRCQSVVERRHTIPILANILLQTRENMLCITATDLEVGIRSRIPVTIHSAGAVTVSAKKLFDIIKELNPEQDITLEAGDGFVSIRSGRSRFRLSSLAADEYPDLKEEENGTSLTLPGSVLAEMIAATGFAMSTDETRKYLTGTLFDLDEQQTLRLVTTDGHRLALAEARLEQKKSSGRCIVPRKTVMEMRKLCEEHAGQVELFMGERQIRLLAGENILSSKLIDASFPVYQDVIPSGNPNHAVIDRSELDQVLRRCMIVANEFTHDVRLNFHDGKLEISTHNAEQEESEESIAVDYSGEENMIGFNGRYLRDVLSAVNADSVCMDLRDALSPVLMYGENSNQARYVIMPMRI